MQTPAAVAYASPAANSGVHLLINWKSEEKKHISIELAYVMQRQRKAQRALSRINVKLQKLL